jgi:hypothetical protein
MSYRRTKIVRLLPGACRLSTAASHTSAASAMSNRLCLSASRAQQNCRQDRFQCPIDIHDFVVTLTLRSSFRRNAAVQETPGFIGFLSYSEGTASYGVDIR